MAVNPTKLKEFDMFSTLNYDYDTIMPKTNRKKSKDPRKSEKSNQLLPNEKAKKSKDISAVKETKTKAEKPPQKLNTRSKVELKTRKSLKMQEIKASSKLQKLDMHTSGKSENTPTENRIGARRKLVASKCSTKRDQPKRDEIKSAEVVAEVKSSRKQSVAERKPVKIRMKIDFNKSEKRKPIKRTIDPEDMGEDIVQCEPGTKRAKLVNVQGNETSKFETEYEKCMNAFSEMSISERDSSNKLGMGEVEAELKQIVQAFSELNIADEVPK